MDFTRRLLTLTVRVTSAIAFCLLAVSPASALEITLERPEDRAFVRDLANMLDKVAEDRIRDMCDKLLTDKTTPIIVVTIESMANHGGAGMRIETFATLLFNQWQIGHESIGEEY
jgi:uncharacterized protein